jgi:hypothetical protein
MRERKVFSTLDWDRLGCKVINLVFLVVFFPLVPIIWIARIIDDYGSEFVDWVDEQVKNLCWYYVKWRKSK